MVTVSRWWRPVPFTKLAVENSETEGSPVAVATVENEVTGFTELSVENEVNGGSVPFTELAAVENEVNGGSVPFTELAAVDNEMNVPFTELAAVENETTDDSGVTETAEENDKRDDDGVGDSSETDAEAVGNTSNELAEDYSTELVRTCRFTVREKYSPLVRQEHRERRGRPRGRLKGTCTSLREG